jgi:hypothetical protein
MSSLARLAAALVLAGARAEHPPSGLKIALVAFERIVWTAGVARGDSFDIAFTHSAEKCRWTHHYVIDGPGEIRQVSSTFPCVGAGMRATASDGSPIVRTSEGYVLAAPLLLTQLPMLNSRAAGLVLSLHGREWRIGEWFPDYGAFDVVVR